MDDLAGMGYSLEWRTKILHNAMKGYCRVLMLRDLGVTKRNRPGYTTRNKRRYKKLIGKSNWFKQKEKDEDEEIGSRGEYPNRKPAPKDECVRNEKTFENVMFITHTHESKLKKEIQKMEDSLGWKDRMK